MIKKTLGLLIIGFGIIINYTNAITFAEKGVSIKFSNNENLYLDNNLNFYYINGDNNIDYIRYKKGYTSYVNAPNTIGRKGNGIYVYKGGNSSIPIIQGYINKFITCTCKDNGTNGIVCNSPSEYNIYQMETGEIKYNNSNCTISDFSIEQLYNYYNSYNYYGFGTITLDNSNKKQPTMCFAEGYNINDNVVCLYLDNGTSENYNLQWQQSVDYYKQNIGYIQNNNVNNGNQIQTIRTGHNYYCPTFKQLLSTYPSNYSTGLCYNGTLKYENGQLTTVQKQDMFTIFTDYEEYQNYVYLYNNYCTGPATQTACENAFNGEREKYSIISNAYNKNVDDKKMWQYCNMALNYDLNTTTCTAGTGTLENIGQAPTPENLTELIEQLNNIGDVQIPITGNILNQLLDEGETREDISAWNILGNLDQIKEKLSNIFEERTGTTGIIPDYIMWLIMVSLLLTVLLKK